MNHITIIIGFTLFLVPVSIMLETVYEWKRFQIELDNSIQTQIQLVKDIEARSERTEGLIIASIKQDAETKGIRDKAFAEMVLKIDMLSLTDRLEWSRIDPLINKARENRPPPLLPER